MIATNMKKNFGTPPSFSATCCGRSASESAQHQPHGNGDEGEQNRRDPFLDEGREHQGGDEAEHHGRQALHHFHDGLDGGAHVAVHEFGGVDGAHQRDRHREQHGVEGRLQRAEDEGHKRVFRLGEIGARRRLPSVARRVVAFVPDLTEQHRGVTSGCGTSNVQKSTPPSASTSRMPFERGNSDHLGAGRGIGAALELEQHLVGGRLAVPDAAVSPSVTKLLSRCASVIAITAVPWFSWVRAQGELIAVGGVHAAALQAEEHVDGAIRSADRERLVAAEKGERGDATPEENTRRCSASTGLSALRVSKR
jgi:hypothetical protein